MRHTVTILAVHAILVTGCALEDFDQDGVPRLEDCNDADPSQGRPVPLHLDGDRDGYGGSEVQSGCPGNAWLVDKGDDCNDDDPTVHPGAFETGCDGRDNDCDPSTPDGPAVTHHGTWPTVQAALDAARFGDVITLCPSHIRENLHVSIPVTIQGAGKDRTVIDGASNEASTLELAATTTVRDLTVTGGHGSEGGGIRVVPNTRGPIRLQRIAVRNNHADDGGGIWIRDADVTLQDTEVADNQAERGGGLFVSITLGNQVSLDHTTVRENQATSGGALWLDGSIIAEHTTFSTNRGTYGGGVWLNGTVVSVTRTTSLERNDATEGGGVFGAGTLDGIRIEHNVAEAGGGICGDGALSLTDTDVVSNIATAGAGGGVLARTETVWMGGLAQGNQAVVGGALAAFGAARLSHVTLLANVADVNGGAVFAECSADDLAIDGGQLFRNEAPHGAGLWVAGRAANLWGLRVVDNVSPSEESGAIELSATPCGPTTLDVGADVTWAGNQAFDIWAGDRAHAAPPTPFSCTVTPAGADCPSP